MGQVISYEDACKLPKTFNNYFITDISIFKEASENGQCMLVKDINTNPCNISVIYKMDDLGGDAIGIWLDICSADYVNAWEARDYKGNLISGKLIKTVTGQNLSLNTIIAEAQEAMKTCPNCHKEVPYKDQVGYSFAGRCCKECLPGLQAIYERDGWYN